MPEPSIGDSKRKGIGVTAITALAAMQAITKPEYVVGGIVLITITFMFSETIFKWIDRK